MANPKATELLQSAAAHEKRGNPALALTDYRALLLAHPDHPDALMRLAERDMAQAQWDSARQKLDRAADAAQRSGVGSKASRVYEMIGALERQRGDLAAALTAIELGQRRCGEVPALLWDECEYLREIGAKPQRLRRLNRLAFLQPNDPVILAELGLALVNTPMNAQAIKPLRAAFERGHRDEGAAIILARLEIQQSDMQSAEARLRNVLTEYPNSFGALAKLLQLQRAQCRWAEAGENEIKLLSRIAAGENSPLVPAFDLLDYAISPQHLRAYVERTYAAETSKSPALTHRFKPYGHGKIRVGYLSADFHTHAVACHIVGLFEAHDKGQFECHAFSCGPRAEADAYRVRLKRAFDHWHDLNDLKDADAAALITSCEIDVLVDLSGLTHGARLGVLDFRPAPFVIHYLGYPGTLAHSGIDFLVADATVIPPEHDHFYAEQILRMPTCYQVNDHQREHPSVTTRAQLGLPDDSIVISNFNRAAKWSELFVRIWVSALAQASQAVLWLADPGERGRAEILELAKSYGVDSQIFWAPQLPMTEHLARLGAADLALDQLPYSSHATGASALWMGVPLLTCLGDTFQGRVGASLVRAAELPEFVADDVADYATRLTRLLAQPKLLFDAKQHLLSRGKDLPLFDTHRFARDWEQMLTRVVAR